MKGTTLTILITVILILSLGGLAFYLGLNWNQQKGSEVSVKIDKTVIVEKVQNLSKLQTIEMTIQRDLEVELSLGSLNFFGKDLLEDKAKTEYSVTGSVYAGVDLSKLTNENVKLEDNNLTIQLPSPELLNVKINEDKTKITSQDFTLLFNIKNLDQARRKETQDELQRQAIKQANTALIDGACTDNILNKANENAKKAIENLFIFSDISKVQVNISSPGNCSLN